MILSLIISLLAVQADTQLRGRIVDPVRAAVVGARITAVPDGGTTPAASTVSDDKGEFTLALIPGQYTITVTSDGFLDLAVPVTAAAAASDPREFMLTVAGVRETVNVSAPAGYQTSIVSSSTKTPTPLRDVPQSITVVTKELMRDQMMTSVADVVRYVPGIVAHQGENNRDQVIIRGNSSSADFFLDGVRDDVQYYRDLYNLERVEALKGSNAMIFGRGGGGGVVNRVSKVADFLPFNEFTFLGGSYDHKRVTADVDRALNKKAAGRFNAMYENSGSFRQDVAVERFGINPTLTLTPRAETRVTLGYEHFRDNRTADRGVSSYQNRPVDVDRST